MVSKTLSSGYVGQGQRVKEFEEKLSAFFQTPILTTNSCTSALDLALHLAGVKEGDEVITTPLTCTATNGVIVNRGAIPVWADVLPNGCIDPSSVYGKTTIKTKAIMAVDWGGSRCDYAALREIEAGGKKYPIIQDAAHSFHALDHVLGGHYTCWSFQAIKFLTTGDGGALAVPPDQYERAKLLRWYGLDRESKASFRCDQDITEIGYKYHMNDIAASIGLANMDMAIEHRHQHFRNCRTILGHPQGSAWVAFTRVKDRDAFMKYMLDRGIETSLVHKRNDLHTAFIAASKNPHEPRPELDRYASEYVAIPCGWWLSEENVKHVKDSLDEWNRR